MYNFNHLYYFYVAAKSGGVNAAAKHLNISQPSLSSQLKVLEKSVDRRLFQRVGRQNQLTPAGQVMYGFCRQIFELSESMFEVMSQQAPAVSRRINIGVSDEIEHDLVVEIVSDFFRKQINGQRPKVAIVTCSHEELVDRLRFRELDVGITQLAIIDAEIESLQKVEIPVVLVCSARWKAHTQEAAADAIVALQNYVESEIRQWLMPAGPLKIREETNQFFKANQLKGRVVFESDLLGAVIRAVIDEMGSAFLPVIYLKRALDEKNIRIIGPNSGFWKYPIWLMCHVQNTSDPLIRILSNSFKEACHRNLEPALAEV